MTAATSDRDGAFQIPDGRMERLLFAKHKPQVRQVEPQASRLHGGRGGGSLPRRWRQRRMAERTKVMRSTIRLERLPCPAVFHQRFVDEIEQIVMATRSQRS